MGRDLRAFTLLELLIVMGILLILAAVALPNLLNAKTRSQVVVARSHTESVSRALELYSLDFNQFPLSASRLPEDPFGILSHRQLVVLTTPIGYISPDSLLDPFGVIESQVYDPALTSNNDFPRLTQPNSERSLLYFHYPSMAFRKDDPTLALNGASTISIGPDRKDSLGSYRPFDPLFFLNRLPGAIARHPHDTVYQPTNGVQSGGDIGAYVGEARRFAVP